MDEEILQVIDELAAEILTYINEPAYLVQDTKKELVSLLESRFIWVINYTHNQDAILE